MADVKWIKIATDIFDDDKILLIESMPDADAIIVIWFKLLCMAGKQNNSGVFMLNDKIAYTDEMLATIFRRNINTVRLALKTFEQFGMIEMISNTITIPNWEKHQQLDSLEKSRAATRARVAKYREKQKLIAGKNSDCNVTCNCTETPGNADRIREDKRREEYIYNDDDDARARACACVREGITPEDVPNAFGDDDCRPDTDTIQQYAINNLKYMGVRAMQEFESFVDDLPEPVVRHGIDNALDNDKRTWSYVRAILNSYVEAGVKTVQEAVDVDKKHNERYVPTERARSSPQQVKPSQDNRLLNAPWY